ncbi:MAG: Lrp/AsnC family transcriptional regulator [Acidimicrobiia bacterium]|nr:Lrp/AsnC family transcriptional regulator [Acidimicrobiia bacterium]
MIELSKQQKELLNIVQWSFPVCERPFEAIGEKMGISEETVIEELRTVKEANILRQLSAIFDTRALGYQSALIAAKYDEDQIEQAAKIINEHPGVSHNYKRNNAYNLWYTIAVPPSENIESHVALLHNATKSKTTRQLPTLKLYKIGVKLDMTGETKPDSKSEVLAHEKPERKSVMDVPSFSEKELAIIRELQEDLPLVPRPFAAMAFEAQCGEEEILNAIEEFKEKKYMRRFAAVMNHRHAGYKANAMGVWAVPEGDCEEVGPQMAGFSQVSHCYKRPTYSDWPYTIFTMVHGKNAGECEQTIEAIANETGIKEYELLWSIKEYKKVRVRYFTPEWDAYIAKYNEELTNVQALPKD